MVKKCFTNFNSSSLLFVSSNKRSVLSNTKSSFTLLFFPATSPQSLTFSWTLASTYNTKRLRNETLPLQLQSMKDTYRNSLLLPDQLHNLLKYLCILINAGKQMRLWPIGKYRYTNGGMVITGIMPLHLSSLQIAIQ